MEDVVKSLIVAVINSKNTTKFPKNTIFSNVQKLTIKTK